MQAEDLEVHKITCGLQIVRNIEWSRDRDDDGGGEDDPREARQAYTPPSLYTRGQCVLNHIPNTLLHSANGTQADSNGQSKRLSMSGQPRGPGGYGKVEPRPRRRIRNAIVSTATTA